MIQWGAWGSKSCTAVTKFIEPRRWAVNEYHGRSAINAMKAVFLISIPGPTVMVYPDPVSTVPQD